MGRVGMPVQQCSDDGATSSNRMILNDTGEMRCESQMDDNDDEQAKDTDARRWHGR